MFRGVIIFSRLQCYIAECGQAKKGYEMRGFCVFLVGLGGGVSYAQKGAGFSAHKVFGAKYYPVGGGDFQQNSAAAPTL